MFGILDVVEQSPKIVHGFHGDVAFFELYIEENAEEAAAYPDLLRDLVIQSQNINSSSR